MSIPASQIVQVNPGVIDAGGSALNLNGVILTADTAVPINTAQLFPTAQSVSDFFGPSSTEASMASVYFAGRNNATVVPGALYFFQYPTAAVGAYLRSASPASLASVQALTGTLTITFNGTPLTSSSIYLSTATSFSNAATIIEAAFTTPPFGVTYDSVRNAFVVATTATGSIETITYATGTIAAGLLLTQATGAVLSQGADAATPAGAMDAFVKLTLNWATFTTVFEPVTADKLAFSEWTNAQNNRFAYVGWDTDATITGTPPATNSWMYEVNAAKYSGTFPVYLDPLHAAFVLGVTASLDFNRTNGRSAYAFKYLSGLVPSVTDATVAQNLQANGYNFIGSYATANDSFTFLYPGSVSGLYGNMTRYVNQIYLNSQLQLALMSLLTAVNSIPYNTQGYSLIHAACDDPIKQALNFGTIRAGVPLSALQIAEVNNAAGVAIDTILSTRGWYLQILPATAQVRAAGGSPPITLWYTDGGDCLKITLASILVE